MLSLDFGCKLNIEKLSGNVSIYYARINDLLASAHSTYNGSSVIEKAGEIYKIKTKKNIGQAYIQGFETVFNYKVNLNTIIYSNFTMTYGNNMSKNEPVGGIPPAHGLAGIKWSNDNMDFNFYVRLAAKQNRLSSDDKDDDRIPEGGTPGWQPINIRSGYNIRKSSRLQFSIENLFDINYREHGSGINGPGRNFIVSLEMRK